MADRKEDCHQRLREQPEVKWPVKAGDEVAQIIREKVAH
jgi:hypothetical protein